MDANLGSFDQVYEPWPPPDVIMVLLVLVLVKMLVLVRRGSPTRLDARVAAS